MQVTRCHNKAQNLGGQLAIGISFHVHPAFLHVELFALAFHSK